MQSFTLLLLLQTTLSLHLTSENQKGLLLPKTQNLLNPFNLATDNTSETETDFQLTITCNDNVKAQTTPTSIHGDFCKTVIYTDKIKNLNQLLASLKLTLNESADTSGDFVIKYKLLYSAHKDDVEDLAVTQTMTVASSVPVVRLNTVINYEKNSETAFNLKIAEISKGYFRSSSIHSFSIVLREGKMPDWVQYNFDESSLYFSGSTPGDLKEDFEFSFAISDKTTGLSSEDLLLGFSSSSQTHGGSNKMLILTLFVVLSVVVIIIILVIYVLSKKGKLLKFGEKKENPDETQKDVNVLSDSILNWNKKLVEKHRSKGLEFEVTEGSGSGQKQAPAFSYNKFDESFDDEEEGNSAYFKVSDKLSQIEHVEEQAKKEDVNRSSFFDDISFN